MIAIPKSVGYVYSIDIGNGKVKVGCSRSPEDRIYQLSKTLGLNNPPHYISKKCLNYRKAESSVHKRLGGKSKYGEFFRASFNESIDVINRVVIEITEIKELAEISKENKLEKKQTESMLALMSDFTRKHRDCNYSEEYNAIINDAVSWCDSFGIDMIDKLISCDGDILEATSVSLLIHKEVIKKYSDAIGFVKEIK